MSIDKYVHNLILKSAKHKVYLQLTVCKSITKCECNMFLCFYFWILKQEDLNYLKLSKTNMGHHIKMNR